MASSVSTTYTEPAYAGALMVALKPDLAAACRGSAPSRARLRLACAPFRHSPTSSTTAPTRDAAEGAASAHLKQVNLDILWQECMLLVQPF